MLLLRTLQRRRPLKDTTARNAVARFETNLRKKFASQLEGFDESQLRELETLTELFKYLDEISSDEETSGEVPKRNRATSEGGSRPGSSKPPSKSKRRKQEDPEEVDEDSARETSPRTRKRGPKPRQINHEQSERSEDEIEEAVEGDLSPDDDQDD